MKNDPRIFVAPQCPSCLENPPGWGLLVGDLTNTIPSSLDTDPEDIPSYVTCNQCGYGATWDEFKELGGEWVDSKRLTVKRLNQAYPEFEVYRTGGRCGNVYGIRHKPSGKKSVGLIGDLSTVKWILDRCVNPNVRNPLNETSSFRAPCPTCGRPLAWDDKCRSCEAAA